MKTLKQTVKYFKEMVDSQGATELCPCGKDDMEMTKIALKALEKQVKKKVVKKKIAYFIQGYITEEYYIHCPTCNKCFGIDEYIESSRSMRDEIRTDRMPAYCPNCGQKLDWRY